MTSDLGEELLHQRRRYLSIIFVLISLLIYSSIIISQQSRLLHEERSPGILSDLNKLIINKPAFATIINDDTINEGIGAELDQSSPESERSSNINEIVTMQILEIKNSPEVIIQDDADTADEESATSDVSDISADEHEKKVSDEEKFDTSTFGTAVTSEETELGEISKNISDEEKLDSLILNSAATSEDVKIRELSKSANGDLPNIAQDENESHLSVIVSLDNSSSEAVLQHLVDDEDDKYEMEENEVTNNIHESNFDLFVEENSHHEHIIQEEFGPKSDTLDMNSIDELDIALNSVHQQELNRVRDEIGNGVTKKSKTEEAQETTSREDLINDKEVERKEIEGSIIPKQAKKNIVEEVMIQESAHHYITNNENENLEIKKKDSENQNTVMEHNHIEKTESDLEKNHTFGDGPSDIFEFKRSDERIEIDHSKDVKMTNLDDRSRTEKIKEYIPPPNIIDYDANKQFISGLDDIGKFLEEVDPPDELDVGADGTSIQDVLMKQGGQIILKKVQRGINLVRNNVVKLKKGRHSHNINMGQRSKIHEDEIERFHIESLHEVGTDEDYTNNNISKNSQFQLQVLTSIFDQAKAARIAKAVWKALRKILVKVKDFVDEIVDDEEDEDEFDIDIFDGNDDMNIFFNKKGFGGIQFDKDDTISNLKQKISTGTLDEAPHLLAMKRRENESNSKKNAPNEKMSSYLQKMESLRRRDKNSGHNFGFMNVLETKDLEKERIIKNNDQSGVINSKPQIEYDHPKGMPGDPDLLVDGDQIFEEIKEEIQLTESAYEQQQKNSFRLSSELGQLGSNSQRNPDADSHPDFNPIEMNEHNLTRRDYESMLQPTIESQSGDHTKSETELISNSTKIKISNLNSVLKVNHNEESGHMLEPESELEFPKKSQIDHQVESFTDFQKTNTIEYRSEINSDLSSGINQQIGLKIQSESEPEPEADLESKAGTETIILSKVEADSKSKTRPEGVITSKVEEHLVKDLESQIEPKVVIISQVEEAVEKDSESQTEPEGLVLSRVEEADEKELETPQMHETVVLYQVEGAVDNDFESKTEPEAAALSQVEEQVEKVLETQIEPKITALSQVEEAVEKDSESQTEPESILLSLVEEAVELDLETPQKPETVALSQVEEAVENDFESKTEPEALVLSQVEEQVEKVLETQIEPKAEALSQVDEHVEKAFESKTESEVVALSQVDEQVEKVLETQIEPKAAALSQVDEVYELDLESKTEPGVVAASQIEEADEKVLETPQKPEIVALSQVDEQVEKAFESKTEPGGVAVSQIEEAVEKDLQIPQKPEIIVRSQVDEFYELDLESQTEPDVVALSQVEEQVKKDLQIPQKPEIVVRSQVEEVYDLDLESKTEPEVVAVSQVEEVYEKDFETPQKLKTVVLSRAEESVEKDLESKTEPGVVVLSQFEEVYDSDLESKNELEGVVLSQVEEAIEKDLETPQKLETKSNFSSVDVDKSNDHNNPEPLIESSLQLTSEVEHEDQLQSKQRSQPDTNHLQGSSSELKLEDDHKARLELKNAPEVISTFDTIQDARSNEDIDKDAFRQEARNNAKGSKNNNSKAGNVHEAQSKLILTPEPNLELELKAEDVNSIEIGYNARNRDVTRDKEAEIESEKTVLEYETYSEMIFTASLANNKSEIIDEVDPSFNGNQEMKSFIDTTMTNNYEDPNEDGNSYDKTHNDLVNKKNYNFKNVQEPKNEESNRSLNEGIIYSTSSDGLYGDESDEHSSGETVGKDFQSGENSAAEIEDSKDKLPHSLRKEGDLKVKSSHGSHESIKQNDLYEIHASDYNENATIDATAEEEIENGHVETLYSEEKNNKNEKKMLHEEILQDKIHILSDEVDYFDFDDDNNDEEEKEIESLVRSLGHNLEEDSDESERIEQNHVQNDIQEKAKVIVANNVINEMAKNQRSDDVIQFTVDNENTNTWRNKPTKGTEEINMEILRGKEEDEIQIDLSPDDSAQVELDEGLQKKNNEMDSSTFHLNAGAISAGSKQKVMPHSSKGSKVKRTPQLSEERRGIKSQSEMQTSNESKLRDERDILTQNLLNKPFSFENFKDLKANAKFVSGLDDIEKFLEEVDVPDELDVGAVGTSLQDVLVGQGGQILVKRIRMGADALKKGFNKVTDKIKERGNKQLGEKETYKGKPNLVKAAQSIWNFITEQIDDDDEYDEDIFADNTEMGNFFKSKGIAGGLNREDD